MRDGYHVVDLRARPPTKEILTYFTPDHLKFFGGHLGMKTIPPSYLNASVELFFQEADRAGVDRMLCVHRVVPAAGGSPRSDVSNDHIAEVVHAHPDRLSGVAGIDVGGDFGDPLEETRRAIDELGLRGIHIAPTRSALATHWDDRRLYPLYELCDDRKVPVVLMSGPFAGPEIEDTHPRYIQGVARDFPNLSIVAGHACWPFFAELLGVAYRHENVYVSADAYLFMPGGDLLVQAANGFLQDQMMYGSGYPVREIDACLDAYMQLPLSDTSFRKTLGENAVRVFGLPGPGQEGQGGRASR
ncbi:amidohydrolase [Pigmentiphaga sp. H8]|uniref:amidohydrolase family protein n=1 Tax=unclassified Pigmentiphaga TaxID=2626614 RepID=UPI000F5AD06B|nr:amidohydrolase family protein [Pigmentiphaga sp. H8]AZG11136.1 amidohydrolase [Pigmentiphaga sp. H8]